MSEQAVKLFEALAGVDEELLERSNQKANHSAAYKRFRRYGKAMAACACLIVVGAATWSGYRLMTGSRGAADSSGSNQAPAALPETALMMDTANGDSAGGAGEAEGGSGGRAEAALERAEDGPEAAPGSVRDEEETALGTAASTITSSAEADIRDMQSQATGKNTQNQMSANVTDNLLSAGNGIEATQGNDTGAADSAGKYGSGEMESENALSDSRQMISWAEAGDLKPFSDYLPTALPIGYEPFSARRSANPDLWDNVLFQWSNGEQTLCLNMTLGEVKAREDLERSDGMYEYLAEEFRRELIPEPLEGRIMFTLYYPDGMRIDFDGSVTIEEMWEVVESM